MNRRRWLGAGVAGAAVAAGLGWAVWHERRRAEADAGLWGLRFDRPDGAELVMADFRGRPLVLNFWATWCPPCVKEMPELDRFHREFAARGWQVVGLAIDGPTPVREFLQRVPVGFPIGLAGFGGTELGRQLGNLAGGLPFTVVFGRDGAPLHRKMGETNYAELAGWANALR
ncbi:MAG: TlpA family protein disulfide reductase [Burkholderiaceae bacterium]|jgi:thiol-disulfide isomerase/thioredoxin|nr:TlpA family protein disulfide reductase [Burkholderiaceae bacterium]